MLERLCLFRLCNCDVPSHTPVSVCDNYKCFKMEYVVTLIGDANVGKSSMLDCLLGKEHNQTIPTIGVDYAVRTVLVRDTPVKLKIFDTGGQERFRSITRQFLRSGDATVIVFDVSNYTSFNNVIGWTEDIDYLGKPGAVKLLAGNKIDKVDQRQVSSSAATKLAKKKGLYYFEVSATTGENVDGLFSQCAEVLLDLHKKDHPPETIRPGETKSNKSCCSLM